MVVGGHPQRPVKSRILENQREREKKKQKLSACEERVAPMLAG